MVAWCWSNTEWETNKQTERKNSNHHNYFMKIEEYFVDSVLIPKHANILGSTYQLEVFIFMRWYAWFRNSHGCISFHLVQSRLVRDEQRLFKTLWHIRSKESFAVCVYLCTELYESAHRIISTSKYDEQWPKQGKKI